MTRKAMGIPMSRRYMDVEAEKAAKLPILDRMKLNVHAGQTSTKANRTLSASDSEEQSHGRRIRECHRLCMKLIGTWDCAIATKGIQYIIREIDVTKEPSQCTTTKRECGCR